MKGTYPLQNPCSNPTLSVAPSDKAVLHGDKRSYWAFGGEGRIRTYGPVTRTAAIKVATITAALAPLRYGVLAQ